MNKKLLREVKEHLSNDMVKWNKLAKDASYEANEDKYLLMKLYEKPKRKIKRVS